MVGDLENIHISERLRIRPQETMLGRLLDVSGQKKTAVFDPRQEHERPIIDPPTHPRRRIEHPKLPPAHTHLLSGPQGPDPHSWQAIEVRNTPLRVPARSAPHLVDRKEGGYLNQAGAVIQVRVAENQRIQPSYTQAG